MAESELVYCFGTDRPVSPMVSGKLSARPVMLAPAGSTLRTEQDQVMENLFDIPPTVVCEGQLPVLQALAGLGIADTILPRELLPPEAAARCASFDPPRYFYLLRVYHPGRTLPASVKELPQLLDRTFGSYFSV